ncbi:MAG: hypothetical protein H6623_03560 [Bdellovibrionaceae bacterium]|nr:hypothetical protein [Pseudobdellovibrionaceae bacterium]
MSQDNLRFRYSAFLQNVEIEISSKSQGDAYHVDCFADLKLPILKKQFTTQTTFADKGLRWLSHQPVAEKGQTLPHVTPDKYPEGAIDPIGFFLKLHRQEWLGDSVCLVVGGKAVMLDVKQLPDGFEVARPEKNQKLIVRTGVNGIEQLEVPLPVIGALKIKRID